MEHTFFHKLSKFLWTFLVATVMLLAAYVSVGRLAMSAVASQQQLILHTLNARLPFVVAADRVEGQWRSFNPQLVLSGLRLGLAQGDARPIELDQGRVTLDVWQSLRNQSLQISSLRLDGLNLQAELTEQGELRLVGLDPAGQAWSEVQQFLLNLEQVQLGDNTLDLTLPDGSQQRLGLDLTLSRDGGRRELDASFSSASGASLDLVAAGLGNPFAPETYNGDVYLRARQLDVIELLDWLPQRRLAQVSASGKLDLELWLVWDEGTPSMEASLAGRELALAATDQSWRLPLDELTLDLTLRESGNRFTLYVSDIQLRKDSVNFSLPRLQLDAWGDSLRLRAHELPLGPATALASQLQAQPQGLLQLLLEMQPSGQLSALELHLDDLRSPAAGWDFSANFEQLRVASWRGAPGVTAATGFVHLRPGEGEVILDSSNLGMDFPTVYRQPLAYESFYGSIALEWDQQQLTLASGLMTATGDEGTARALFGLKVPFASTAAGIEMDLLVGLEDSEAKYRGKYLPYILDPTLLHWLDSGLTRGRVDAGGFLWRGSLKADAAPLRTVQLFFNVSDTALRYHPDWPPLSALDGVVLIDDSNVSVWSQHARLYDSAIKHVSAEAWSDPKRGMLLAIDGELNGPAADGLQLLNDSPLATLLDDALSQWEVSGDLHTRLHLQLELRADAAPMQVQVAARVQDVALAIRPGDIDLENLAGEVDYSSATGFSSRDLRGELWQQPFTARVSQESGVAKPDTRVTVHVATDVDAGAVQAWLLPQSQMMMSGMASTQLELQLQSQQPPVLELTSDLVGVELALPEPLAKAAGASLPLALQLPLGGDSQLLSLSLGSLLNARADVSGWQLQAASLALQDATAPLENGIIQLRGHAPAINGDAWYLLAEQLQTVATDHPAPTAAITTPETMEPLRFRVDELLVDSLAIYGQDIRSVILSAEQGPDRWRLQAETDWLRGSLALDTAGNSGRLELQHLDLGGLQSAQLAGAQTGQPLQLPRLAVSIDELRRNGKYLGSLDFSLATSGALLQASTIQGSLAGLQFSTQQPAQLRWWQQSGEERTELEASLQFTDLSENLSQFGYEPFVETESGQFQLDLQWPGAPQNFALAAAQGSLDIDVASGRFLNAAASASGTLRVVSILSLADIVRRLSLSHMFEAGIPFDRVTGEALLHEGVLEVPSLRVQGAASSFEFSGVSTIATEDLDGQLVATLPVANNLPWVAALAAGLPVAAGVYVVSKVFEKQVNRFSSAVYRLDGSWDDPDLKFSRIFDTGKSRQREPGAADAAAEPGQQPIP